jgi:hypothetical protein
MIDEKKVWRQNKPSFCPHHNCRFIYRVLDDMCGGELPEPEPHNADFNTHRFCLNRIADDGGVLSLQINKSDVGWFRTMFDVMFP